MCFDVMCVRLQLPRLWATWGQSRCSMERAAAAASCKVLKIKSGTEAPSTCDEAATAFQAFTWAKPATVATCTYGESATPFFLAKKPQDES